MLGARSGETTVGTARVQTENTIHGLRGRRLHRWQNVRVGVQSHQNLGVSEPLRDDLRVHVLHEQECCHRVPQVMKSQALRKTSSGHNPVEGTPSYAPFSKPSAMGGTEDRTIFHVATFSQHPLAVLMQCIQSESR